MVLSTAIRFLVDSGPGRTAVELAKAIFGVTGYQQRVNQDLNLLISAGKIARRGLGGISDPYRYYPVE